MDAVEPPEVTVPEKGLAEVVAAQTALSDIDGKMGILSYCGYDIHDLAQNATFEEVVYLLQNQRLPNQSELEDLNDVGVSDAGGGFGLLVTVRTWVFTLAARL